MPLADVLRLVAVPVLGWAAYRDVKVRRVPSQAWYPLVALGVVLLAWEGWRLFLGEAVYSSFARRFFLLRVGVSLGMVAPLAYLVWRLGGFGGADAKALMALAVLFPGYPTYVLGQGSGLVLPLPAGRTAVGVFSLTILTNTVLLGASYPLVVTVRNLLARNLSPVMLFGKPVAADAVDERHGSLLETPEGYTRSGLDIDALRMYLQWRGASLAAVRDAPERFRDPASLPAERADPGDGAIATDGGEPEAGDIQTGGGEADGRAERAEGAGGDGDDAGSGAERSEDPPAWVAPDDEWGAAAFLEDVGWGAYGTDPDDLRAGLELLASREEVWYSPGLPFIVPMFAGLVVALTLGDLLFYVLQWLAVV